MRRWNTFAAAPNLVKRHLLLYVLMAPAASIERNRTCRNAFRSPSARLAFHLQGRPMDRPTSPLRLISASRLSARCLAGIPTSGVPAVASVATGSRMNSYIRIMKWTERPAKSSSGLLVLTVESLRSTSIRPNYRCKPGDHYDGGNSQESDRN